MDTKIGQGEQMATVDVLIPTFNRPVLLRKAVESVLAQTFQDFRVLIWDDASTTRPDLPDDPRIECHRSEKNYGVASSRNSLFDLVEAPYACFLDDDDTCHPQRLEKQLELIQETDCDVVLCWIQWVKQGEQPVQNWKSKGRTSSKSLCLIGKGGIRHIRTGGMNFATAFFKKAITQYRFYQDPRSLGEATLWWNILLKNGIRVDVAEGHYYKCLIHKGKYSWKKPSKDPAVQMEPSGPTG